MNRKQRRAELASARKRIRKIDHVVAVHEAGHAIGRYLTANEMGYETETSISCIEVAKPPKELGLSRDGRMFSVPQATTYGPLLSADMNDYSGAITAETGVKLDNLTQVITSAREAGADVSSWIKARALIALLGPLAEADYTDLPASEVMKSYECEDDTASIIRDGMAAGLSSDEISKLIDDATKRGLEFLRDPLIYDALNRLAAEIKRGRTIDGSKAVQIINGCLTPKNERQHVA